MRILIILALLIPLCGYSQHYDRISNSSRQIVHFENSAYELYASDLIYGRPDESGLSQPLYRVESFQNYLYKVVDIESGSVLDTYRSGASVTYSRFGKYWAAIQPESPDYSMISGMGNNGPQLWHKSDIFHEGSLINISELNDQYITIYSKNMLNCFSLSVKKIWTYRYPYGDVNPNDVFLSSDESALIISDKGIRVLAIDMKTGKEIWQYEGKYSAVSIPYALNPFVILYDHFYSDADILDQDGKKLYHLKKSKDLKGDSYLYMHRLVNGNIVVPNILDEESRVNLPVKLASNNSEEQVSPITWSTEATFFTRMFAYQERLDPPDSTLERYRIDVVSASGREMGYFYPRILSKLDHSNIRVQISNDGSKVLMIGKYEAGIRFICREYEISL